MSWDDITLGAVVVAVVGLLLWLLPRVARGGWGPTGCASTPGPSGREAEARSGADNPEEHAGSW